MLVSSKIHNVRLSMKLDEKHFGMHFRQSTKTILDWENGYVIPTREQLRNISRYTRIAIDVKRSQSKLARMLESLKNQPNLSISCR